MYPSISKRVGRLSISVTGHEFIIRSPIVACVRQKMHVRCGRQAFQKQRVPPQVSRRAFHQRTAAQVSRFSEMRVDHLIRVVGIIPIGRNVLSPDEIDKHVLVRKRHTHRRRVNGPIHGHDLPHDRLPARTASDSKGRRSHGQGPRLDKVPAPDGQVSILIHGPNISTRPASRNGKAPRADTLAPRGYLR